MKVYIVTHRGSIVKVFDSELSADKYIVSMGQLGFDKIIKEVE